MIDRRRDLDEDDSSTLLGDPSTYCELELEFDEPVSRETRLVAGLAFESRDVLEIALALEQGFGCSGIAFDQLPSGHGHQIGDLSVAEIADHVVRHF